MKEAGGRDGENRAGTGIPRPTPLGSHRAVLILPAGSPLAPYITIPRLRPPPQHSVRLPTQSPDLVDPPLRLRPPVRAAYPPQPVRASSRRGLNWTDGRRLPHASAFCRFRASCPETSLRCW